MASIEDKAHAKFTNALADSRVSPAVLAMLMRHESKYVNESLLQYFVSYVQMMAESKIVPMQLSDIQKLCKTINISLQELGLTGETRYPEPQTEYLAT
jgi:hypothetical protein